MPVTQRSWRSPGLKSQLLHLAKIVRVTTNCACLYKVNNQRGSRELTPLTHATARVMTLNVFHYETQRHTLYCLISVASAHGFLPARCVDHARGWTAHPYCSQTQTRVKDVYSDLVCQSQRPGMFFEHSRSSNRIHLSYSLSSRATIPSAQGPFYFLVHAHTPANATIFITSVSVCAQHGQ